MPPTLSRRAGTPKPDPTTVVYVLPLMRHEAQLVVRAVKQWIAAEGVSVPAHNVLQMLERPLERAVDGVAYESRRELPRRCRGSAHAPG
jgi:hypothetical protein